jgi:hypothetical protein
MTSDTPANSLDAEIAVSLTLRSPDLDPEQITGVTGLAPTKTWRVGEPIREGLLLRHKQSGWSIASGLPHSQELEDHVEALLRRLGSGWRALVDLGRRYDAEVDCAVYCYGGVRPAIHLSEEQLHRLAELNAALDIDLYILPKRRK